MNVTTPMTMLSEDMMRVRLEVLRRARVVVEDAAAARLARALASPRQLEEVLVEFWFNHFNILQMVMSTECFPTLVFFNDATNIFRI
jgi:hypothetical protein